ncbi:MAG: UDP-N-acetylmuramate--L-alanine ligase [Clostridiales bacterium]|jgi:UDP-N-acetylmuramate--alanine ligase|nr:UDP-N-acetylmuramate--L-alanine ligase [Clostridiales bacterium]
MKEFNFDFYLPRGGKVFFVGIGGVSMSGLAEILAAWGYSVSGSDFKESEATKHLRQLRINVLIGHSEGNISSDVNLVVHTSAVKEDNPEIIRAKEMKIPVINRASLLGEIIKQYPRSVGVAGMHGKTTTTSAVTEMLLAGDPTVALGGYYKNIGGNYRIGKSGLFIFEADEYCDSFLKFYPTCGVILNIEEDHLDYFSGIGHIRKSFRKYAENIKDILVINSQIENLNEITDNLSCKVVTFKGVSQRASQNEIEEETKADFYAKNISFNSNGNSSFDIYANGKFLVSIKTKLTGFHNIDNTLAAFAACYSLGEGNGADNLAASLSRFLPAQRRFEQKGIYNGAVIIDDYAHHPTEIKMALFGARQAGRQKIICIFQPHTYSRTISLFNDFASSFEDCDEAAFVDIFAARENDPGTVSSRLLSEAVKKTGKESLYFESFEEAAAHYKKTLASGEMLITMGAGDVYRIGEMILSH